MIRFPHHHDFRAPMAIAVIGGLVTSPLLSLFYIPVVFTCVDDLNRWLRRKLFGTRQHRQHENTALIGASH